MLSTSWDYRKAMTRSNLVLGTGTCYLPDDIGNTTNKCILGLKDSGESYLEHDYLYYKANLNLEAPDSTYTVYIPIVIPEDEFCTFDLTFLNEFKFGDYDIVTLNIHICVFDPRSPSVGYLTRYDEMDRGDYTYPFRFQGDTYIRYLNLSGEVGFDSYQLRYNYYAYDGPINGAQDL